MLRPDGDALKAFCDFPASIGTTMLIPQRDLARRAPRRYTSHSFPLQNGEPEDAVSSETIRRWRLLDPGRVHGPRVSISRPPYREFTRLTSAGRSVPEAAVLAFRSRYDGALNPASADWLGSLRDARRSVPHSLLVLCLDPETKSPQVVAATKRASEVGVRLTLVGEPTVDAVRDGLRASGVLAVDVASWLEARICPITPEERGMCWSLGRLRKILSRLGLPTLHKFVMAEAVLPPVVALQTLASSSVEEALTSLHRTGCGDRRTLDRRCVALTGFTTRRLGGLLGWEVVLGRMIGRKFA